MTVTAGTVLTPGNEGALRKKYFDFLADVNNQRAKAFRLPDAANVTTTTASETGQAIDLTDELGASAFLTDHIYRIQFRSIATTNNDRWVQVWEQYLLGGTTPVLLGSPLLLKATGIVNGTASEYGFVRYHGTTSGGTVTNGADRDAGLSLGNFTSGAATLTIPLSRATARCLSAHISEDAGTVADSRAIQVRSATTTTMTVNTFDVQNATPAISSPVGVNNVDIHLYILPPPSIVLAMNSNNVEVTIGHDASETVRHAVDVWLEEDGTYSPFGA